MEQNVQISERVAVLVKQLPACQQRYFDIDILSMAITHKIIAFGPDNTLVWLHGNKTLLAYFCGRMCCGDSSFESHCLNKNERVWQCGDSLFPNKSLTMLFGTPNLRQLRERRCLCTLPRDWQKIDEFFSK